MSATTTTAMGAAEELAAIANLLAMGEVASSEAAMHLNDVVTGEYAHGLARDAELPSGEVARLVGLAYAARHSAIAAVQQAEEALKFLLDAYTVSVDEEAVAS